MVDIGSHVKEFGYFPLGKKSEVDCLLYDLPDTAAPFSETSPWQSFGECGWGGYDCIFGLQGPACDPNLSC